MEGEDLKGFGEYMHEIGQGKAIGAEFREALEQFYDTVDKFSVVRLNSMGNYRLMIAGSRSITEFDISQYIPEKVNLIITGGANGVDKLAEQYADKNRISKVILYPDYSYYGKRAPLERNKSMVDISDEVLAVWDGQSHGTKQTIDYAKKKGKKITVVHIKQK